MLRLLPQANSSATSGLHMETTLAGFGECGEFRLENDHVAHGPITISHTLHTSSDFDVGSTYMLKFACKYS